MSTYHVEINGQQYRAQHSAVKCLRTVYEADLTVAEMLDHLSRLVPVLIRSGQLTEVK